MGTQAARRCFSRLFDRPPPALRANGHGESARLVKLAETRRAWQATDSEIDEVLAKFDL